MPKGIDSARSDKLQITKSAAAIGRLRALSIYKLYLFLFFSA